MLILFPVHASDYKRAIKTLELSADLGFQKKHHLIILCPPDTSTVIKEVLDAAKKGFENVQFHQIQSEIPTGWPQGPNAMFYEAISLVQRPVDADRALVTPQHPNGLQQMDPFEENGHFLWWEPDAVPLHATWLDKLNNAYIAGQKPFAGVKATSFATKLNEAGDVISREPNGVHMVGVGIYPRAIPHFIEWWQAVRGDGEPFDILFQNQICERLLDGSFTQFNDCGYFTHNSRGTNYRIVREDDGIYVQSDPHPKFPNGKSKFLWSHDGSYGALFAHGCKDDSIYAVSRQLNGLEIEPITTVRGKDSEGNPVDISLGADGLKLTRIEQKETEQLGGTGIELITYPIPVTDAGMQSSSFADTEEDDEEYQEYLAWKKHKNREAVKANATAKPKSSPTTEEITEYYREHGWRKTLSHFKIGPKQLKPIKDSLA